MFNFWTEYKDQIREASYGYSVFTLTYATVHVLSIRIGIKETADIFGIFGVDNFVMVSLMYVLVATLIRTYLKSRDCR